MTSYPQGRARRVEENPANAPTEISIRVWSTPQPGNGNTYFRWDTDSPIAYMIGDIVQASEGSPQAEQSQSLVAGFASQTRALTAARRIQHAVREFTQHRPESCFGVSISIHPPAGLRGFGDASPAEVSLAQSEPGQILVAPGTYSALRSLPGIEFGATPQSAGVDRELIWTTPENYQWFRELHAKNRKNASPAGDGAIAGVSYAATRIWNSEEGAAPPPVSSVINETTVPDDPSGLLTEESGIQSAIGRWWWAAATAIVLVLVAVMVFLPSGRKRQNPVPEQVRQASPEQNVTAPGSLENRVVAPVAASEEKRNSEPPLTTAQPDIPDTSAPEPQKHPRAKAENSKKETNAALEKHGMTEYEGFTSREIPQLLRRADADAGAGNYDQARRAYEIVLKLDPGNVTAKQGLHRVDLREQEAR